MRITTKVIQNNALSNINTNKILQNKLNTQMTTEKKITRPSDDPVVAIRALRLRTNVSQVTQFYEKNIPDAESWMKVTEDALSTVSDVVTDMIEQCQKGANEKLTSTDRATILDALTQLKEEVYATGNADYAGRSVFTGYRTESTLKFTADTTAKYSITEQLTPDSIDSVTYISTGNLNTINDTNYTTNTMKEQSVTETSIHRIRLSYSDLDGTIPKLEVFDKLENGSPVFKNLQIDDGTGTGTMKDVTTTVITSMDEALIDEIGADGNPTGNKIVDPDGAFFIKETGELLIGDNVYSELMKAKDDPTTENNEAEFRVTYDKSNWKKDDLRPEHYFACTDSTDAAKTITYNEDYLTSTKEKQSIEYDVGLNQAIKVNTTADEVFQHSIGRDVDDLLASLQEVTDMEKTVEKIEKIVASATGTDKTTAQNQLDAANKALTLLKEKSQKLFESGITKMQGHLNTVNYAVTTAGTRSKKLELIQNRLMSQKTNFETLQADNENADMTDVAIELKSAQLTYDAALMATGKIMQTSLMNYI